ncbi:MAG: helix-turn-helix domain-containing protein [Methanothrix sp.]|uniref:helix-turn-helix domain-containing protein n=1 Tax=Methanothrix sp. TaxID=90426 RepID=UPI0032AF4453|nr:helix-turn-helix domain-containing protein [Methanothrix sp.]
MKLTQAKVRCILRQNRKGVATKEIARDMKVSQRRVQQIIKSYRESGREPLLGEHIGRPCKPYDENEAGIVRAAHARYRFGARMLEHVIRKQYKVCISHIVFRISLYNIVNYIKLPVKLDVSINF